MIEGRPSKIPPCWRGSRGAASAAGASPSSARTHAIAPTAAACERGGSVGGLAGLLLLLGLLRLPPRGPESR